MTNLHYTVKENGVGVVIHHVNLAMDLAPYHTLQIRHLLHRYRVAIFPDQNMDNDQLRGFACRFGPPFLPDRHSPVLGSCDTEASSGVVVVGNQAHEYPKSYLGHQEVLPHSDHQWLCFPSSIALLYAVDIAENSPPTIWTDMVRTYTRLDPETREVIQDLRLITYNPFYREFGTVSAKYVDRRISVPPGDVYPHPLVRTHPETREKILYLNAAYEIELVGIPYEIGEPLIAKLQKHVQEAGCQYVHQWKNGDLVLWDNQATLHYRPAFKPSIRRVLKRVSVGGGIPY